MRCNNCIHYDVCYQYDIIGEDDSEMCALYEQERPHGEWKPHDQHGLTKVWYERYKCSNCNEYGWIKWHFCPNCGASMSANDRQVTGKLNSEPKDSHAEYWNSIGEWKEGGEK